MTDLDAGPDIRLTEWTSCGGCAAKWGAAPLSALVRELVSKADPALLVGLAPFDDAAVYKVSDDLAIVSTTDFFPPLVDDPSDFGAIAAANVCSDVFAMGGRVVMALNISAFPERMPVEAIGAILSAAAEVVREAGGVVAGGHTIRSEEPIFGLAVQGLVHPDHIFTKAGAVPGDVLVLSKPLGTGIVLAGGTNDAEGGGHHPHEGAEPGGGRGPRLDERSDGRRGACSHRRDRVRPHGSRLGDGRAIGHPSRVRRVAASVLRRARSRRRPRARGLVVMPATASTSRAESNRA